MPAPKGDYRHWLSVRCWWYKEALHRYGSKIGPAEGCLSVYTGDNGSGVAVYDRKAKLNPKRGGTLLYGHPGRSMPPIDGVFRLGGLVLAGDGHHGPPTAPRP